MQQANQIRQATLANLAAEVNYNFGFQTSPIASPTPAVVAGGSGKKSIGFAKTSPQGTPKIEVQDEDSSVNLQQQQ